MKNTQTRIVGYFSKQIINILELDIPEGTAIYLGQTNIEHMKSRHPYEFDKYYYDIETILQVPDYVGFDKKNNSVDFVKEYAIQDEYIQISVRVSTNGVFYARTMFSIMTYKFERYIRQGTLKPVP